MYGDDNCCIRIKKLSNGYTVTIADPAIVKYNRERDKKNMSRKDGAPYLEYKDPDKTFVFKDKAKVLEFLKANLDKAIPTDDDDEFATSFKLAAEDD